MILAAGKGTRMRPLTQVMPKPMIPLVRKPVMESIIEHLRRHGFDQLFVNTSYLSQSIEDYFRDGERCGVEMAYSYEGHLENGVFVDRPLGSAGGMRKIQESCGFFDDTFAVLCGDSLIDVDLTEVVRQHRANNALATIVTKEVPREDVSKYGVVVTDDSGRVLRFQEKPAVEVAASCKANTGIYIFEPGIFDFIPSSGEFDIGGQLFPALVAANARIFAATLPFQWVDIGCVADFWNATQLVLGGGVAGYQLPGREVRPGVRVGLGVNVDWDGARIDGPVYIGSGSRIEAGAVIEGPTVIGANCVVEANASLRQAIVGDYTRVGSVAHLERQIVFAGQCIDPFGESLDIAELDIGWLLDDVRKRSVRSDLHESMRSLALSA
jgi:mannose-1-phosphate guanylyltransferase